MIGDTLKDAMIDTKAAVVISTGTTSSGIGSLLNIIPNDIGKLGVIVGMVLSTVLIVTHIRRAIYEYKDRIKDYEKKELELAILRKNLENDSPL
jgi:hypothetical protein